VVERLNIKLRHILKDVAITLLGALSCGASGGREGDNSF
jgi:hypothetical protein